jgi:hypothetical protein
MRNYLHGQVYGIFCNLVMLSKDNLAPLTVSPNSESKETVKESWKGNICQESNSAVTLELLKIPCFLACLLEAFICRLGNGFSNSGL